MIESAGESSAGFRQIVAVQLALATILAGLLLMAIGAAAPQLQPPPTSPARTWRPATELERREYERQRLLEEMDRLYGSPPPTH
ncbi:hypothetical protein [Micromonospora sp. WMMD710]|uniref:hypothetical protein n=1 Tax=Micromonospora sp. WMMD710 TaxID=3016085 RepID=UPI00241713B7|nr:hypothetical protein [Micromonospora sp. WMMD710]MDG4762366.1 hypothetical protein [Micromonospora sp. WMMD710]MDG4762390.1 hypothetical protein [Micromonospora sp. WMMD710]MDG4762412.1 hypothetical protein [Micromonospora sp. WMMD710]MDG4762458.1 hypothetical protein [Micromonospora sp. WMMD710]MDG4762493.1 hypothetical protein [Micromonospora sp. WMMD710]